MTDHTCAELVPAHPAEHPAPAAPLDQLDQRMRYAQALAASGILPAAYRRQPASILYALAYADALALPLPTVLTGLHVMDGRPTMSAQLMGAVVRRAGHRLHVTADDTTATATLTRGDDPAHPFTVTFTMADAQRAGLAERDTWRRYPRAMLAARATAAVCREGAPDALAGVVYTPDELDPASPHPAPATVPPVPPDRDHLEHGRTDVLEHGRADSRDHLELGRGDAHDQAGGHAPGDQAGEHDQAGGHAPGDQAGEHDQAGGHAPGDQHDGRPGVDPHPPALYGPDAPVTDRQLALIGVLLRDLGVTHRTERIELVAGLVGRAVTTSKDLTRGEASAVVDRLRERLAADADGITRHTGPAGQADPWAGPDPHTDPAGSAAHAARVAAARASWQRTTPGRPTPGGAGELDGCATCGGRLDPVLAAAGATTHPGCDPLDTPAPPARPGRAASTTTNGD